MCDIWQRMDMNRLFLDFDLVNIPEQFQTYHSSLVRMSNVVSTRNAKEMARARKCDGATAAVAVFFITI